MESLATVSTVTNKRELVDLINNSLARFLPPSPPEAVHIEPYGYDARIGWDTYVITLDGYGVWGFAKGSIPD
jgi:hypothetical protein